MNRDVCSKEMNHTPCPHGYVQRQNWAEEMLKTHRQVKCSGCGLYKVWVPKKSKTEFQQAKGSE